METTVFLVPGLAGERAAGQRRQTIFVVVLAMVLEKAKKRCPACSAGRQDAAMSKSRAIIWAFSRSRMCLEHSAMESSWLDG
ncbi:hypothetical protein NCHU2750_36950 [Neorhizobium sp. NCHU2750]|nr:hypothetical protein NCHU2750_36950 [Neorhizobium sp. NCHU2750]